LREEELYYIHDREICCNELAGKISPIKTVGTIYPLGSLLGKYAYIERRYCLNLVPVLPDTLERLSQGNI
jgi:hypothetical protein